MIKKKRTLRNGKNGNKTKKRNLTTFKTKLKKSIKKMISFGINSISKKKPIGNKNIMLTGFNGK